MRGHRRTAALLVAAGAVLAGCGQARQDVHEPSGTFTVQVLRASFPTNQKIAQSTRLHLVIKNAGSSTLPDLAVSVDSFDIPGNNTQLASRLRPVWIVDNGPGARSAHPIEGQSTDQPGGAVTAYTNTWALGPVPAGQTRVFDWRVTAVKAGVHTVTYTVAAGLNGKARARTPDGRMARGRFTVNISQTPAQTHVDPSGRVVPGPPPLQRG